LLGSLRLLLWRLLGTLRLLRCAPLLFPLRLLGPALPFIVLLIALAVYR
jgi:hypothetical protein